MRPSASRRGGSGAARPPGVMAAALLLVVPVLLFTGPVHGGNDSATVPATDTSGTGERESDPASPGPRSPSDPSLPSPMLFTGNRGQLDEPAIRYYDQGGSHCFTDAGLWLYLPLEEDVEMDAEGEDGVGGGATVANGHRDRSPDLPPHPLYDRLDRPKDRPVTVLRHEPVGARPVAPVGAGPEGHPTNFLYGRDPDGWVTGVPGYPEVWYHGLWDGIDLRYYNSGDGLKYDLVVHPGADAGSIRLRYAGADGIGVDDSGALVVSTPSGDITDGGLYIYQGEGPERTTVPGQFELHGDGVYGFEVGTYDRDETLVIDPAINHSTYIGGSGYDAAWDMVEYAGHRFITGTTLSMDLPVSVTGYATQKAGDEDAFVLKVHKSGTYLEYCTYLGGNGTDIGTGIDADYGGVTFVTGCTGSTDFPMVPPGGQSNGTWDNTSNGEMDAFVIKLDNQGSELLYSTYLGGAGHDGGEDIQLVEYDTVVVTGITMSPDFPITPNVIDYVHNNGSDVFVCRLKTNGSNLLFSTFIGGVGADVPGGLEVDSDGNIYVAGRTSSPDFPTTIGAYSRVKSGSDDIFALKMSPNGSNLGFSTFIGGSGSDRAYGLALDSEKNLYMTGETFSAGFPLSAGAFDGSYNGGGDAFALRLSAAGDAVDHSTFIGGSQADIGMAIAVEPYGLAYITGQTLSADFPVLGDDFDSSFGGSGDAFVCMVNADGMNLLYSSFLGGSNEASSQVEQGTAIAVDGSRLVYVAGITDASDFPMGNYAYNTYHSGMADTFCIRYDEFTKGAVHIEGIQLLDGNTKVTTVYAELRAYTFRVHVQNTFALDDVTGLQLILDPADTRVDFFWDRGGIGFYQAVSDEKYAELTNASSAKIDYAQKRWVVDFAAEFRWDYPDRYHHDVEVMVDCAHFSTESHREEQLYMVESHLQFLGNLTVNGQNGSTLADSSLVREGDNLLWKGLTVAYRDAPDVYPPAGTYGVQVADELDNIWETDPPTEPGADFRVDTTAATAPGLYYNIHTVSVCGVPGRCMPASWYFGLRIDGLGVVFSDSTVGDDVWQTSSAVVLGITVTDQGPAGVDGEEVYYSVSENWGQTWGGWTNVSAPSGEMIKVSTVHQFADGWNHMVRWQATDAIGNGPTVSDSCRVQVDTTPVGYDDPSPDPKEVYRERDVPLSVTIVDETTGVDASTVQYSIRRAGSTGWSKWNFVADLKDAHELVVDVEERLPVGKDNYVRWRASDLVGNGPEVSEEFRVQVELEPLPDIRLLSPAKGSEVRDTRVELVWEPVGWEGVNLTYDVYLDFRYPPETLLAEDHPVMTVWATNLRDNLTYFWSVVPIMPDGRTGSVLDNIADFRVNVARIYIVNLQMPDNMATIQGGLAQQGVQVWNSGSHTDTILLSLSASLMGDSVYIAGPQSLLIHPGHNATFDIIATPGMDVLPGKYHITVFANSSGAQSEGMVVFESHSFYVNVEPTHEEEEPYTRPSGSGGSDSGGANTVMMIGALAVIIIMVIAFAAVRLISRPPDPKKVKVSTKPMAKPELMYLDEVVPIEEPSSDIVSKPRLRPLARPSIERGEFVIAEMVRGDAKGPRQPRPADLFDVESGVRTADGRVSWEVEERF